jgi:UDP-N-acetylmuramoyl-L-alanyl-D-glutamate--2,6-diaminopimelate ligase
MSEIAAQFEGSDSFVCIADREEAIRYAFDMAQKDDIILLAGKGHERYQLINGKKEYFCEREIIENCMNEVTLIK